MSSDAGSGGHRGRAAQTVCTRRVLLETVASLGVLMPLRTFADDAVAAAAAQAANDAAKLRPQTGDRLVFAAGPRSGQAIVPGDILSGSAPLSAWPYAPVAQVRRDGSHLNLVRLLRLDPAALTPKTAQSAADGIVAYAAMCSHAGCDVLGWDAQTRHLVCPCHGSQFDAQDAAVVVQGPATRPLAQLPLAIIDGRLVVAGGFTRRVGFTPL